MATYSNGNPQSNAESIGLDDMMVRLKNNMNNDIAAEDVRWTAFSLWDKIEALGSMISDYTYSNSQSTLTPVGGVPVGATFSNFTLDQMFNAMFYPIQNPLLSLMVTANPVRELGSSNVVNLAYSVTKRTENITSIIVNNGSNLYPVLSGSSVTTISQNINTTLAMTVISGVNTIDTTTSTVTWLNSIYIFGLTFNAIYDLTNNPSSASILGGYLSASMTLSSGNLITTNTTTSNIASTTIAGGTRNQLKSDRLGTYLNIGGGNKYITIALPTSFGTPSFETNGMVNTAFTKIVSAHAFRNASGYTATTYDVWMSNTPMNSTLGSLKIT